MQSSHAFTEKDAQELTRGLSAMGPAAAEAAECFRRLGKVMQNFSKISCRKCGELDDDLKMGICFDCASTGEGKLAKRSVLRHFCSGMVHLFASCWYFEAKCDFTWAWQRLTRTGDYAKGGTFDMEGYRWR